MLGLHLLLAIGLATFADTLSPSGVAGAFVVIYAMLRLGCDVLGIRRYIRRLEIGAAFSLWFVAEVFKASADVARLALGRTVRPQPAIVRIRLIRPDDGLATVLACLLTLTPGSMAVDYDAGHGLMYVHAIDADSAEAVEADARRIERWLLRWLAAGDPAAAAPSQPPGRPSS